MTDTSYPVKAVNAHDHSHHATLSSAHAVSHQQQQQQQHLPTLEPAVSEDDGKIACICGFEDDDGWTVACDHCNRWQHQLCYYPQYDEISLPPTLEHYCIDCRPRPVDKTWARSRQLEKRHQTEAGPNGIKKSAPKSHKKKVKDTAAPYANGWATDKLRHDRNSASPRDQPPPAKRPKTSHRTSDSTTTTTTTVATKGHSRKRAASAANHRRSLSRSPDSPIDLYSDNFLQCYMEDEWSHASTNLHNSIDVTNALSAWLNSSDEEFKATHGQAKGEVLMRWDGDIDTIPGKAQIEIQDQSDNSVQYNGTNPTWKWVTVEEPVPVGAYIGELKGRVCFKQDYQDDAANRWSELRHPEPFVFFHPKMPIVIDARHEGTDLRFVRRSCHPNARLQILVTDSVDYHFCFMATQQIEPGQEIAVGWDTSDGLPGLALRTNLSDEDMELLSGWVSTALANCGPCACPWPEGECMMSRFDRRTRPDDDDRPTNATKASKSKKRRGGQTVSPLNTNALNSRSGSEARKMDPDDDGTDSRSVSGSADRGSASRDITPNTHYSTNGQSSGIPEMSERERKKLAKEEEMFRRQEEERAGKHSKKKRNSGGSNLNTPSATSSKQLGFPNTGSNKYADAGTSRQMSQSSTKPLPSKKPRGGKVQGKPAVKIAKRPRPVYTDAETQCDLDEEDEKKRAPTPSSRRQYKSLRQRLLDRVARNNAIILASAPTSPVALPQAGDEMDVDQSGSVKVDGATYPTLSSSPTAWTKRPFADVDEDMPDAPADKTEHESLADGSVNADHIVEDMSEEKHDKTAAGLRLPSDATQKPAGMHIQMPPPPSNPFAPPGSISQSPASMTLPSVFSPAVTAAVTPTARKSISLSDWTRRKKKTTVDDESKADRESSPASTTSGPIVPSLQAASSTEAMAASGSAIDEDVKMEESDTPLPTKLSDPEATAA